ncbi:aminoglycoside phosphotransferase family protein [Microlunatus soli]|uniref:Streptomycin 6-kinase n=1 Tax=Microlunatus soli TaxID=630515 RepID=A0A1H2AJI5_9ACTN|nr:aminoglycoside phosphotransferase family protein [Microlunatus soli]SDT45922.1 streptomycin 6-kinase [Microlunatus soli]
MPNPEPGRPSTLITVPESFREMPRWWHDVAGRDWLDALPDLVSAQCRRWDLDRDGPVMHGSNALAVPVRRHDQRLVLRLAPPGDDVAGEAAALRIWDGRGTVRLFDVDHADRAMLLERLDGTRTLRSEPLGVAIPIIAGLVGELAVPVPDEVRSTASIARAHTEKFERDWSALDGPTPRTQLDRALELAAERATETVLGRAVDGDLHSDQVLAAERAPWLVVDPVLLRGDPEYDFARVLWDRLDELPDRTDVLGAFETFVAAAGLPDDRARSWIVLRAMSYLLWGIPRGLTWDPPKCRRLLDLFC